jgi:TRAP-type C4-dicarboxylate transport system permease small subunit
LLILVIVALPFIAAVVRYATGEGYTWLAEFPPQLVPWVVFPLLGVVLRHDGHIAVDVLPHYVKGRALTVLRAAVLGACLLAAIAFAIFGANTVLFFKQLGQVSTTEIEFPLWVLYLSYPLGFALAANFALESLLGELVGGRRRPPQDPAQAPAAN